MTHQSEGDRTRTLWTAKCFLWPSGFLRSVCSKEPRTVWDERCRYPAHGRDRRGDSWEGRGALEASHSTGSPMAARKTFIHPKWKHAIQPPGSCGCFSPALHRDAPVCFPSTCTLKPQYERVRDGGSCVFVLDSRSVTPYLASSAASPDPLSARTSYLPSVVLCGGRLRLEP